MFEQFNISLTHVVFYRQIEELRAQGYNIVYLDETWVTVNHQPSREWASIDGKKGRCTPQGKGKRIIVLHCGGRNGFIPECELVFKSQYIDGRDYHSEMNAVVFTKWIHEQLLPNLHEPTVIVMDNASYHRYV